MLTTERTTPPPPIPLEQSPKKNILRRSREAEAVTQFRSDSESEFVARADALSHLLALQAHNARCLARYLRSAAKSCGKRHVPPAETGGDRLP